MDPSQIKVFLKIELSTMKADERAVCAGSWGGRFHTGL
jgi:hypothetical protein